MNLVQELKIGVGLTVLFVVVIIFSLATSQPITPLVTGTTSLTTPTTQKTNITTTFSLNDVVKHNNQNNCWLVIGNNVYDATDYLFAHPGGAQSIIPYCGADATAVFQSVRRHGSSRAKIDLSSLFIGSLK